MKTSTVVLLVAAAGLGFYWYAQQRAALGRPIVSPLASSTAQPADTRPQQIDAIGKAAGNVIGAIGGLFD